LPTAAMVSSSMLGLVNGRNGRVGWVGCAVVMGHPNFDTRAEYFSIRAMSVRVSGVLIDTPPVLIWAKA
jgi:hypothetical protein